LYAQNERRELGSLLEAVPGFDPSAYLVVINPPGSPTVGAADNPNAIPFAYGDAGIWSHVVRAPNSALAYSQIDEDGAKRMRILMNSTQDKIVDPATSILLFFSVSQGRFVRLDRLPAGLLRRSDDSFAGYQPARWLRPPSGKIPRVVAEFLGSTPAAHLDVARRKPAAGQQLLKVDPALRARVQVDSLTPYVLEPGSVDGSAVWLGASWAAGYSSLVWSRDPLAVSLTLRISPGPARPMSERVVVRQMRPDGSAHVTAQPFDPQGAVYAFPLQLNGGANTVEVWLEGPPPIGEGEGPSKRHLNGYLDHMWLRPPVVRPGAAGPLLSADAAGLSRSRAGNPLPGDRGAALRPVPVRQTPEGGIPAREIHPLEPARRRRYAVPPQHRDHHHVLGQEVVHLDESIRIPKRGYAASRRDNGK
jgi:hypothetical protein